MKFKISKEKSVNPDTGHEFYKVYDDDNTHIGDYLDDGSLVLFDDLLQEEIVEEAIEDAAEYGLKRFGLTKFISAEAVSGFVTKYILQAFSIIFNLIKGLIVKK
jgi:hypothetical protein